MDRASKDRYKEERATKKIKKAGLPTAEWKAGYRIVKQLRSTSEKESMSL